MAVVLVESVVRGRRVQQAASARARQCMKNGGNDVHWLEMEMKGYIGPYLECSHQRLEIGKSFARKTVKMNGHHPFSSRPRQAC